MCIETPLLDARKAILALISDLGAYNPPLVDELTGLVNKMSTIAATLARDEREGIIAEEAEEYYHPAEYNEMDWS